MYLAVADGTGHGVPGAFMSLLGINILENAINFLETPRPSQILNFLSESIRKELHVSTSKVTDGMDIAVCRIDSKKKEILFSGAYRP